MTIAKHRKITCNRVQIESSPEMLCIFIVGKSNLQNIFATIGVIYWLFIFPQAFFPLFKIISASLNGFFILLLLAAILILAGSLFFVIMYIADCLLNNVEIFDYEVWRFETDILQIFQFKAPCKIKSSHLNNYLHERTLIQIAPRSEIEQVTQFRRCNDGGCYYYFVFNAVNFSISTYPSEQDAILLSTSINDWLRK